MRELQECLERRVSQRATMAASLAGRLIDRLLPCPCPWTVRIAGKTMTMATPNLN